MEHFGTGGANERYLRAMKEKKLRPDDFSLRALAEAYMGSEWVANLRPKSGRDTSRRALFEAEGAAVSYSDFVGLTGQIFFTQVHEGYEAEENVFSKVVPSKPTIIQDMEKFPGITEIGDEFSVIGEEETYPNVGVSRDYTHRAALEKRGRIVNVTKEAILGDLTGLLLKKCKKLGEWLGVNKEKRIIDAMIDENGGAVSAVLGGHRYHWLDTSYASYQATTPWINVKTSNGLVDFTDIEQAWLLLVQITDPYTGEPIRIKARHLIVTPQNSMTALRIKTATNVQTHAGGYATSGNLQDTHAPSPVQQVVGDLTILSSQQLAARAATDTDWWMGDLTEYMEYAHLWDIETEEAPSWTPAGFERDVQFAFKASEKGRAWVKNPRYMVENRA